MPNDNVKEAGVTGTILVADDTNVLRSACRRALERVGHRVLLASDGVEAMAIAMSENIDAALLDLKMPGPSGLEVLKKIKMEKPFVEVVIMTAYATQDIAEEATHLGASGFLTKPFTDPNVLTEAVGQAVTRKKLREKGANCLTNIEDLLMKENLINKNQLNEAKDKSKEWSVSVKEALLRLGFVQAEDFDWVIAKTLDIPFARISEKDVDRAAAKLVPAHLARRYRMIPLLVDDQNIHIALDDPFNKEALETVERKTGLKPVVIKGYWPEIDAAIKHIYPEDRANIEKKISALSVKSDPNLLLEIFESARITKLDKAEFRIKGAHGADDPKQWVFRIEGVIAEDTEEDR